MSQGLIYYFGYGSLVNRQTRPPQEPSTPATLSGWRRIWNHRVTHPSREQPCTSLSIEALASHETGSIEGVLVPIMEKDLPQLDERESGYERLALPTEAFTCANPISTEVVMVYQSLPTNQFLADVEHPVLQSYVDCVMDGYHNQYGMDGLERFMSSTVGWQKPLLDDRESPFYPRAVLIDDKKLSLFDEMIEQARQQA